MSTVLSYLNVLRLLKFKVLSWTELFQDKILILLIDYKLAKKEA